MKKHLFLLGSFMASSLVAANTLLVISCKKKASVKGNKDDEKGTTEQVEFEKTTKLKNEIRNIIDDVIANPSDKSVDWIINLADGTFNDSENIIKFLNETVEGFKDKTDENKQIALEQLTLLDSKLKDKIKEKFASLSDIITKRINANEDIEVSNFQFEFNSESIKPILTALNGVQVMQAVAKLKPKSTLYSLTTSSDTKEEIDKIKIELFKVKTDLTYSFKFGSVKDQSDSYNDAELLLTGDINNYDKVNRYTQDTVKDFLTTTKHINDVSIFSSDTTEAKRIHTYGYIGKQMDWDFSKPAIKDEIKSMQYDNIIRLKKGEAGGKHIDPEQFNYIKDVLKDFEFDQNYVEFEIDASRQMKFDNYELSLGKASNDCILICALDTIESSKAIKNITKQFFSDNETDPKKWNGGKINNKFIEQVKKDGAGVNPRINLDQYYGLSEESDEDKDLLKDMLIGYGQTSIRKAKYAGIALAQIVINTNLVSSYSIEGMKDLYLDFTKYVETYISAIRNEKVIGEGKDNGLIVSDHSYGVMSNGPYLWQWRFGNEGEWDIIQEGIKNNPEWNGAVSFDWIMDHVLYEKRINGNNNYELPKNDGVLDTARTSVKSKEGLKYQLVETEKYGTYLDAKSYVDTSVIISVKFGPFIAYLTGNDVRTSWTVNGKYGGIWSIWQAPR